MLMRCLQREFRLCFYHSLSILNALLFLLVIATLFPLATSPDSKVLQFIGPGVIWVCALLTMLLSMQQFFKEDYQDGCLDHLSMMPAPLSYYVIAKVLVHWLWVGLPLILLTPLIGLLYQLSPHTILILMMSLTLGTPSLILIAAILAALTVTLRQNSVLILLMALPLYAPILIFGAAAPFAVLDWPLAAMAFLAAILVLAVSLLPVATAGILRSSIKQ